MDPDERPGALPMGPGPAGEPGDRRAPPAVAFRGLGAPAHRGRDQRADADQRAVGGRGAWHGQCWTRPDRASTAPTGLPQRRAPL